MVTKEELLERKEELIERIIQHPLELTDKDFLILVTRGAGDEYKQDNKEHR